MERIRKKKIRNKFVQEKCIGLFRLFSVILLSLLLAFCSPKTAQVVLPVKPPGDFSFSGDVQIPQKWWMVFNDKKLNALVDSAMVSNLSLKTAWQRLQASRAILKRESATLFPSLNGSVDAEINNRQSEFQQSQRFRLGLYSEYEIDLWGRIMAGVDAQQFRMEAAYADYQTSALILSAEIVRTYFQMQEANNQLLLANEQVGINEKMLQLIKVRFGSGLVRSVDILRQKQLLEATDEQRIQAESRVEVLEHQLAVLLGKTATGRNGIRCNCFT